MATHEEEGPTGPQTVNGKPATVRYDDEGVHWQHEGETHEEHILKDNLIVVNAKRREILYTGDNKWNDSADKASPYLFKYVKLTRLPENIERDFHASSHCPLIQDRQEGHPTVHVIVSTGSGTGLATNVWKGLIEPVFNHYGNIEGKDYETHLTTSETSVSDIARMRILPTANNGKTQLIVLLSGDGGMVDIVNTLISAPRMKQYKKPEIILFPLGTGNALANSSGITGDNTLGLQTLMRGGPKEVPVFRAEFSSGARLLVNEGQEERRLDGVVRGAPTAHGAVVCSWGLHATLVADSDTIEYRKFGAERFKMAGKEALYPSDGSLPHAYKGKVSVLRPHSSEWQALDRREHGYILATLVSNLEAGFSISPSSKPLDGKLRLVQFGRLSGEDAMGIMTKAYQGGQHVHDEKVGYEEILGLRIEFDEDDGRWRRVCVDGKIIRVENGGWVEVKMGATGVVDLFVK